ncbi:MAG: cytochrome P450 [Gammaproteobacteria bacterium]|nr:cytochrome P450 [Gammaproteobacteria bacterium]
MNKPSELQPIPRPEGQPVIGNLLTVDRTAPLQSLMQLAREQGPIFSLDMMGTPLVVVSGAELVAELCDETRFDKAVRGPLRRVRAIAGDGLFTADTQAPNWGKAHRLLMPTFSQQAMLDYLPMMTDVASQLCLKWQRLNADEDIDVVHDMTALALDTIGLCGFGYRFNSFYRQDFHPFIDALTRTLETSMVRRGLPFENVVLRKRVAQLELDAAYMNGLVDEIIRERRRNPDAEAPQDLLGYMLTGVDKVTGERLSDENIRYQINTFLIAGHETTSGLLSFTLYFLLKHPDVLAKAYEEVDQVVGREVAAPDQRQLAKLDYLRAILLESLRLWPTAPAFSLYPFEDEIIGGRYARPANTFITGLALSLHRDPTVWGDDPESFDPERFSREAEGARPAAAYKPFGNGQRACIGRQFAMQEAILVLAMVLQRFELIDHSGYQLRVKESLSIKPDGFKLRVRPRPGSERLATLGVPATRPEAEQASATAEQAAATARPAHGGRLYVLFGSNLGSTEAFAREIAQSGRLNGFDTRLAELDEFTDGLPTDGALVIACASYNGTPPDNASRFVTWLQDAAEGTAEGVRFAVLGCGNRDWAATYQATPRLIDERLAALGGQRIRHRGEADAREDQDSQFRAWFDGLWPDVGRALELDVDFTTALHSEPLFEVQRVERVAVHPVASHTGAEPMTVTVNRELQQVAASGRSTRHLELALPAGATYQPGDHLCVVPRNHEQTVRRAMNHFGFDDADHVRITATGGRRSPFPQDSAVSVRRLAEVYGELQNVASRKDVATLAAHTSCPDTRSKLEALAAPAAEGSDRYRTEVFLKRRSVLDLLEVFPAVELPFNVFLEMIPWMAPRYYSISSSPGALPGHLSITVGVVAGPARSGLGDYHGVCSSYLATVRPGHEVHAVVRENRIGFRFPDDPTTPMIMIGPGTGLAPFRGFLQERSALRDAGKTLGPALLLFGCRHPEQDYLYREELEAAAADGVTDLLTAFSRADGQRVYVQDLLRRERDQVWSLLEAGAVVYVCGDGSHMEPDVKRSLATLYAEINDSDAAAADAWLETLRLEGRYRLDVWAST